MDCPVLNMLPEYNLHNLPMLSSKAALPVQSVQSTASKENETDDLSVFFGIGMTINIIMVIAFVVWASKEWKKRDTSEK